MAKKSVFIVYASHELGLAESLKKLLSSWGITAFYCRQEIRDAKPSEGYRSLLRRELKPADLVILLLSRDFQWSGYCQAEAGATATFEKNQLVVMIPPAQLSEISEISPVLDGFDILRAIDPRANSKPNEFVTALKKEVHSCLGFSNEKPRADNTEADASCEVEEQLGKIIESYDLKPSHREVFSIWPSIDNEKSLACRSIIENIKTSLGNEQMFTRLAFVGVSLKFSLKLIKIALNEFAGIQEPNEEPVPAMKIKNLRKTLKIELIHMDEHAHILHALRDTSDIGNIQKSLYRDWPSTFKSWEKACGEAHIKLDQLTISRIDYIPPRIGILIDDSVLFAGRCSFRQQGTEFSLLVGEREYFHFTKGDHLANANSRGPKMIKEFQDFLAVYREEQLNGVEFESGSEEWIRRLRTSMESHPEIREIILISQTATKFQPLIDSALRMKMKVKIYVQKPDLLPSEDKNKIASLTSRIRRAVGQGTREAAEIYYYDHLPTFRAALIGQKTLGIQIYVHSSDELRTLEAGALRVIATQYSSQFVVLKEKLIDAFLKSPDVPKIPDELI